MRRDSTDAAPRSFLARMVDRLPRVSQPPQADDYLALLDLAMLDRHLSASEQDALLEVAESLELSFTETMELHRMYLTAHATAAWQDGMVSDGVTRSTRVLVAADPDSQAGKADKARRYGIPIVTEPAFAKLLDEMGGQR